jgi:transposase InsO family protein
MAPARRHPNTFESGIKKGHVFSWEEHIYRITSHTLVEIQAEDTDTGESRTIQITDLLVPREKKPASFAPTVKELLAKLKAPQAVPKPTAKTTIPEAWIQKARATIEWVRKVERKCAQKEREALEAGEKFARFETLQTICEAEGVHVKTFYFRWHKCLTHFWNAESMAAANRRSSSNQLRLKTPQIHFADSLILEYYQRDPPIEKATLWAIMESTYERTKGKWIDPDRCGQQVPQDLVLELFDHKLSMDTIESNPEKKRLLTDIDCPSRAWLYRYVKTWEMQPEKGKALITARYGEETWEQSSLLFDQFVHTAARPLQCVFADHCRLKVFVVDEETRSEVRRLWLTLLIDAYSRSVVGFALLYEYPCIDSIQLALLNTIWPKTVHKELGIEREWPCYGIPLQLSLDNAWCHHSISLEDLAAQISQNEEYTSIDLVFRKPYKARWGALIERFFGNLTKTIQERLEGAIRGHHPKDIRNAAQRACLLYEDVYRFVVEEIVTYQNTEREELGGMTPNQKWAQGLQGEPPPVPPLTKELSLNFWRLYHGTREIKPKGVSLFGLHYSSPKLKKADSYDRQAKLLKYGIRYDTTDISRIALFLNKKLIDVLRAKELRIANNDYRQVSIWERELAQDLAREKGRKLARDWLAYINDLKETQQKRIAEQKAAQRKARRAGEKSASIPQGSEVDAALEQQVAAEEEESTERLLRFTRH